MKRSILLADDSPTIQRLVKQTFIDADVEVVAVSNGDAAVKKLPELRPSLVLADVYMPGRNGYEVGAFVKNQPELAHIPVVLLVGAFDAFDADTATQAGAADHITKPFEPQALIDLVNSLMAPASETASSTAVPEAPPPLELDSQRSSALESAPGVAGEAVAVDAAVAVAAMDQPGEDDLLGLSDLFPPAAPDSAEVSLNDEQMDRIVDRVVKKLSAEVIQSVAWDVVPAIAEKAVKDLLKKQA